MLIFRQKAKRLTAIVVAITILLGFALMPSTAYASPIIMEDSAAPQRVFADQTPIPGGFAATIPYIPPGESRVFGPMAIVDNSFFVVTITVGEGRGSVITGNHPAPRLLTCAEAVVINVLTDLQVLNFTASSEGMTDIHLEVVRRSLAGSPNPHLITLRVQEYVQRHFATAAARTSAYHFLPDLIARRDGFLRQPEAHFPHLAAGAIDISPDGQLERPQPSIFPISRSEAILIAFYYADLPPATSVGLTTGYLRPNPVNDRHQWMIHIHSPAPGRDGLGITNVVTINALTGEIISHLQKD